MPCAFGSYLWDRGCRSQQFEIMQSERHYIFGWRTRYRGKKSFHMLIIFSKAKQIYGHFIEMAGEKDPEKFLLSKKW